MSEFNTAMSLAEYLATGAAKALVDDVARVADYNANARFGRRVETAISFVELIESQVISGQAVVADPAGLIETFYGTFEFVADSGASNLTKRAWNRFDGDVGFDLGSSFALNALAGFTAVDGFDAGHVASLKDIIAYYPATSIQAIEAETLRQAKIADRAAAVDAFSNQLGAYVLSKRTELDAEREALQQANSDYRDGLTDVIPVIPEIVAE